MPFQLDPATQLPTGIKCYNADNDVADVQVTPCPLQRTTETGLSCTFQVKLMSNPFADVEIGIRSDNTVEGKVRKAMVSAFMMMRQRHTISLFIRPNGKRFMMS